MKQHKFHPFSLRTRLKSFYHAFMGLFDILRTEPNAWVHAVATVFAIVMSLWLKISAVEFCFIVLAIVLVWMAEAFNTVLEIVVDIVSPEFSIAAKRAKDIAAGGVLVTAVGAVLLALIIFTPRLQDRLPILNGTQAPGAHGERVI